MDEPVYMKRSPTFLIIGAARSGTTAIARGLEQHPDVFLTEPKEPHFFAFVGSPVNFRGPGDDLSVNRVAVTEAARYARLYDRAGTAKALGEGSVSSLYYHAHAIPNIRSYAPDAKLIAVLRDPIARAWSSYMYMVSKGNEPASSFDEALADEPRRIEENWHHIWHYTRMGMYYNQVAAFREAFGPDQFRVFLYEDLRNDPDQLYRQLFDWLGVDTAFRPSRNEVNTSGQPKSRFLNQAIRSISRVPLMRAAIKSVIPAAVRERVRNANLVRHRMPESARERLTDHFYDEIGRLEGLLQRDLSGWRGRCRAHTAA